MSDVAIWVVDAAESCASTVVVEWGDTDDEELSLEFAPDVGSCLLSPAQARYAIGRVREAAARRGVMLAVVDRLGLLARDQK